MMAKYYGEIGYGILEESYEGSGVWIDKIVTVEYSGDLLSMYTKAEEGISANDNVNMRNEISIISDPFASSNVHNMRYITFMGVKWKIKSVRHNYPRLIITMGDVYNEH